MIRPLALVLVLVALAATPVHSQTTTARRLSVGTTPTTPEAGTSVRLQDLATTGGTALLFVDAEGDVRRRVLATGDIPSQFTRRDIAEAVAGVWSFSNGLTGALPVAGVIRSTASTGLPITAGGAVYLAGGFPSPVSGRLYIGDGSGWRFPFTSRNAGVDVDRAWITDTGTIETRGDLLPMATYSGNVGTDARKWLALAAAEMRVETIVAQERIATMGGRLTIGNSNILTRDLSGATTSPTTMCVKYPSFKLHVGGVEYGSKLYMEKLGQFEAFTVFNTTTPTVDPTFGDYCYTVDRNQDLSGQNAWQAGDGIIDTGKVGDGFIDLYAFRGLRSSSEVGPAIQFNRRTGTGHNSWATYTAIGHLNGICGNGAGVWGAVFGNCASGLHLQADATHGIRMLDASNTPYASWDMGGTIRTGVHAPGYPNVVVTASQIQMGRYGETPTIALDGASGNATLNGNLLLASGGKVQSTGNFELGTAAGLKFQAWSGTSAETARSIQFWQGLSLRGIVGSDSNGALRLHSGSSGSGTGVRLSLAAFSFGGIEPGLFITHEAGGGGAESITNLVAQAAWSTVGVTTTTVQFVPLHGAPGGVTAVSRLGNASLPWTHIYGSQFYSNGVAGFTGTCTGTITVSGGVITSC